MAAVTPVPSNGCLGTFADDSVNRQLKCQKSVDDDGNPVYTCATWRLFKANCPSTTRQCNTLSTAYVAAVTVCAQRLF